MQRHSRSFCKICRIWVRDFTHTRLKRTFWCIVLHGFHGARFCVLQTRGSTSEVVQRHFNVRTAMTKRAKLVLTCICLRRRSRSCIHASLVEIREPNSVNCIVAVEESIRTTAWIGNVPGPAFKVPGSACWVSDSVADRFAIARLAFKNYVSKAQHVSSEGH